MRTPFARPSLLFSFFLMSVLIAVRADAGPITGAVVDPDHRAVANAAVLVVHNGAIVARGATDASGRFMINAPDDGEYDVRVAVAGFRAQPVRIGGAAAAKDLGSITLQISAVSESLVVSAAQVEIPLSTAATSITVITRDDLEAHQVERVADALRMVPGLTVSANGARGALTSVFPRGGESDYSLVYVDGVQANTFGGAYDFASLSIANIDRIEIVRGPQSALYGSNAIGSVIRIITRRGGAPDASALVEGGSFDTARMVAATAGESHGWSWGGSAERTVSDNFNGQRASSGAIVANDDYEENLISGAGGWRHASGATVRGTVRFSRDERGFPGPFGSDPGGTYDGIDTVSRGENDRLLASIGGSVKAGRVLLTADGTHSRLDSDFVSQFGDSQSWSRRTTGRVQGDLPIGKGLDASAGLELLGERAGGTYITATGNVLVPVERGLAGFFGEARWNYASRLYVTGGVRIERITRHALDGDATAFSPRPPFADDTVISANPKVSAAWYLTSDGGNFTKVRASAGTGIRPPDAFEIAFTDNPSLQPERSKSFEAGLDRAFLAGRALIEATAFFNNFDDLIVATGSLGGTSRYRTDNISNARSRGLEIAGTGRARLAALGAAHVQIRVAYTLLGTKILAVDDSGAAPPPYTVGDRLLRRPKHQFSADAAIEAGRLTAFVQGNGRTSVRDVDPSFGPPPFGGLYDTPGFNAWNAGASWRLWSSIDIFGRITNLFDREYEEALGFPALGRSAIGGLRIAARR
ncbi:MAG TPA: TonB-dependent receptor [Vicinamibacterales bacterium]|nr:TonB-dependent receptor [Vicinamibacterales bacterium]